MKRLWLTWMVVAVIWAMAGCSSSHGGSVSVQSGQTGKTIAQNFNQAYIAPAGVGEYDIVMLDSAAEWEYKGGGGGKKPLKSIPLAPVQQMMHIHVYWQPLKGATKNPAAINASIDWYVMGSEQADDMLIYEGAGYVVIDGESERRGIRIREGTMKLKSSRGTMRDAIGPATLSGSARGRVNDGRVKDTLEQMKEQSRTASGQ